MASFNPEATLQLEESLLRVPYESMRRTFKQAQKNLEKDTDFIRDSTKELSVLVSNERDSQQNTAIHAKLGDMVTRMKGLKRKLSALKSEQDQHIKTTKARIDYLAQLFTIDNYESFKYEEWSKNRLDILLVDYFLRCGYAETAKQHAKARRIQPVVDMDILFQCHKIEQSLRQQRTTECQTWCQENKTHLRRISSPLEFEIRLQQYIELARERKLTDAISHSKKFLVKNADTRLKDVQQASALLAFSPDTMVTPYKELYAMDRWDKLATMFVNTFLSLHGLPRQSALVEYLATGISALKTYSCIQTDLDFKPKMDLSRGHMCPVCSDELNKLSRSLPYALHTRCYLDSDPVVLPNGRVYGREKLIAYSEKAGVDPEEVADPTTQEIFGVSELKNVFPT
ncbi:glucose-induced degradation complex subunit FYV10 [Sugiyamaella lignohabitans]|uniref:Glucose-induced degradation complex subunit FYV10 n=1 Tax=Sugiyamaella lignohabitans TaxID=796027 RepID=A0A161HLB4_9ASCO|nr:glucose-induced degradation complex subunit FYV10 [Sugiyamaella lignohabitans]ANB14067.1 glucose-induced degradation complex subunit FYV10 [Sugiyamaella lignohabitans]